MTDTEEKHIFFLIINMWFGDTLWPIKANKPALVFTVTARQQSKTDVCVWEQMTSDICTCTHTYTVITLTNCVISVCGCPNGLLSLRCTPCFSLMRLLSPPVSLTPAQNLHSSYRLHWWKDMRRLGTSPLPSSKLKHLPESSGDSGEGEWGLGQGSESSRQPPGWKSNPDPVEVGQDGWVCCSLWPGPVSRRQTGNCGNLASI